MLLRKGFGILKLEEEYEIVSTTSTFSLSFIYILNIQGITKEYGYI